MTRTCGPTHISLYPSVAVGWNSPQWKVIGSQHVIVGFAERGSYAGQRNDELSRRGIRERLMYDGHWRQLSGANFGEKLGNIVSNR